MSTEATLNVWQGEALAGPGEAPRESGPQWASDFALAQRAAGGDNAAFEEAFRLHRCAVGTSKSQLHKARTKLRKILAGR